RSLSAIREAVAAGEPVSDQDAARLADWEQTFSARVDHLLATVPGGPDHADTRPLTGDEFVELQREGLSRKDIASRDALWAMVEWLLGALALLEEFGIDWVGYQRRRRTLGRRGGQQRAERQRATTAEILAEVDARKAAHAGDDSADLKKFTEEDAARAYLA